DRGAVQPLTPHARPGRPLRRPRLPGPENSQAHRTLTGFPATKQLNTDPFGHGGVGAWIDAQSRCNARRSPPVSFEYVKNIMVNGDGNPYPGGAADYERQLRSILNTVKSTGTGKTVMGFFALRSRRAWIVPPEGLVCKVDAGAQPVDFVAAF